VALHPHRRDSPGSDPLEIARRFAGALDRDELAAACALLGAGCVYVARQATWVGPQAIGASCREASAWGRARLDTLAYESQVEAAPAHQVSILFIDHLAHRGKQHRYACRQLLRIGGDGLIERIEHVELPGQHEALVAFLASVGLSRPAGPRSGPAPSSGS